MAAYAPRPYTPVRWAESVRAVCDAFAAADLEAVAVLVEIAPAALPLRRVVGAQLLDTVVHTWDVARALGRETCPPPTSSRSWWRWRRPCRTTSARIAPARRSPDRSRPDQPWRGGRPGTGPWPAWAATPFGPDPRPRDPRGRRGTVAAAAVV